MNQFVFQSSDIWWLHLFGVMASSIFSVWSPNLNSHPQFYLIEQIFMSHAEKKRFLLCLCLKSCGKSLGAGPFILRDGELKSKKCQKGGVQPGIRGSLGWGLGSFADIEGLGKCFIPLFVCSFPKGHFIKLPIAWHLSEWVHVGFLEGHGIILMQLKNHNMG